jgi:hypothetical protein
MLPNKLGTPMANLYIRFYGELNDYLPLAKQGRPFVVEYNNRASVNTLLDSIGVAFSAIDLILVNGEPVGFDYLLQANDSISVYPLFRSIDISPLQLINRGSLI